MDIANLNRIAWDNEVKIGNQWTIIVSSQEVQRAREGDIRIRLTPNKLIPLSWLSDLKGKKVLGLASAGGQQGAILAAFGTDVTIFDNSPFQLNQDIKANSLYNLDVKTVQGDMRDLSVFEDESFDCIINPVSNCFIDNLESYHKHMFRVLKKGGYLLLGFMNPILYAIQPKRKFLKLKYTIPYSDTKSLSEKALEKRLKTHDTIEFSHSFDDQIGGLCKAGFLIKDFYKDDCNINFIDSFIYDSTLALRAVKL